MIEEVHSCDCERSQDIWFCTCDKHNKVPEKETENQFIDRHLERIKAIQATIKENKNKL